MHRRPVPAAAPLLLGALAAGFGVVSLARAQTVPPAPATAASAPAAQVVPSDAALPTVTVRGSVETQGRDGVQATETRIGKGRQELRDIPQSITVVTERLIDDRNLDTLKDALRNTAGITFQAAEGGEEDIRLRGFSLQSTGDIFVDGIRDPAFYERDAFHWDRLELLRGSASMLFGRGSTGGAANQVSKEPTTQLPRREVALTAGSGASLRGTADLNLVTGDSSAVRVNAVLHRADNDGVAIDRKGIAGGLRWGIGSADEFLVSLYRLDTRNGVNYGIPWLPPTPGATTRLLLPVDPRNTYGLASDRSDSRVGMATVRHVHRFDDHAEWRSVLRVAGYDRDLRASAIRFAAAELQPDGVAVSAETLSDATVLRRGTNNKVQDLRTLSAQSDYSGRALAFGLRHEITAGVDLAREDFRNFAAGDPASGPIVKPNTTVGTPNDGAAVDESLRVLAVNRRFEATSAGVYVQDLVALTPAWKLLGGIRWDRLSGRYDNVALPPNPGNPCALPVAARVRRDDALPSHRLGLLYQPTAQQSVHLSYGTSYNTAGDTYQFDAGNASAAPERSRNVELGAKLDTADGRFTTRVALFHATKYNERNRDADSVDACNYVLSGKRHAAGAELDLAGRITPAWEVYASYAYIPDAAIDAASPLSAQGQQVGDPVGLTPRHSGTVWTTYRLGQRWRVGGGINARGAVYPVGITEFAAPRYVTADLMAEYTDGAFGVRANLTNVGDTLYADQVYRGHTIPGKPRTLQVTTTVDF